MANSKILYLECNKRNFRPFLQANPQYFRRLEDGRIAFNRKVAEDIPWLYVRPSAWQNCNLWHHIIFCQIHGQAKVPIPCQSCWKVVLMPRNLEEMLAAWIMQQVMDRPAKAGTEGDRENTDRLYGAYWYNHSLEEGLECYQAVKAQMEVQRGYSKLFAGVMIEAWFGNDFLPKDQHGTLPRLILKRGCTEMEQHCGPSDKWAYDEAQEETERIVSESFTSEVMTLNQSEGHTASTLMEFIHRAFKWGDRSYLKFTNGNRLFSPPVTYHDKDEDFLRGYK